jgi:hypothetical protein
MSYGTRLSKVAGSGFTRGRNIKNRDISTTSVSRLPCDLCIANLTAVSPIRLFRRIVVTFSTNAIGHRRLIY